MAEKAFNFTTTAFSSYIKFNTLTSYENNLILIHNETTREVSFMIARIAFRERLKSNNDQSYQQKKIINLGKDAISFFVNSILSTNPSIT